MTFWRLVSPDRFTEPAMVSHHDYLLCVAAVTLAVLAAWTLLPVTERYHAVRGRWRYAWLAIGSVTMGVGIWAMHFTAMLAYSLPVPISYAGVPTALSILPAIIATASCIALINLRRVPRGSLHLGAGLFAIGVGSMHYVGMEAVVVEADMYYDPPLFILSIVAAYLLALAGLGLYMKFANHRQRAWRARLIGSVLLGFAISSMHFIAMRATYFQGTVTTAQADSGAAHAGIVAGIVFGVVFLLGLVLVGSKVNKRLDLLARTLRTSELRFKVVADTTPMAIFTFDADGVTYANPALTRITGYSSDQVANMTLAELFGAEFERLAAAFLADGIADGRTLHHQFEVHCATGERRWLYFSITIAQLDDVVTGLGNALDMTDQKMAELRMEHLAFTDSLTSLANRALFLDRLQHHLDLKQRSKSAKSCVLLLDLDNFKDVNDTWGHHVGDVVLVEVAARLRSMTRRSDTVARLGGDEFIVLIEESSGALTEQELAERVNYVLGEPLPIEDREIAVSASIGIVKIDAGYRSPEQVLVDADVALYRAKERGRACWVLFDNELGTSARRARQLVSELKIAIREGRLKLYLQPIVAADDNRTLGFEALARWRRANGEFVPPGEFIPLAEDAGLVAEIDLWAVREAVGCLERLARRSGWKGYISVNTSSVTIRDERLLGCVRAAHEASGIERGRLKLEITERTLVDDTGTTLTRLQQLIEAGCDLMIDDFGTGYSSLSYLHRFPVSTVKIDRSFVVDIAHDDSMVPVIRSIRALAIALNMNVIAEGVETTEQGEILDSLGVDQLQGYLFGKPGPAGRMLASLCKSPLREMIENSGVYRLITGRHATVLQSTDNDDESA